jgi:hypothetical protein
MIKDYNRRQLILGILQFAGGIVATLLVWVFFLYTSGFLMIFIPATWDSSITAKGVASWCTAIVIVLAFLNWRRRGDQYRIFKDSAFRAFVIENPEGQYMKEGEDFASGPFDIVKNVMFTGPQWLCTAVARILARLPQNTDLDERLAQALERLRASTKWQPAEHYADHAEEVGALIRLGLVDFSVSKGRLKAVPEGGTSGAGEDPPDDTPKKFDPNDEPLRWDGPK